MRDHLPLAGRLCGLALVPLIGALGGCQRAVLNPAGDIALQQRDLIYASTGLMLIIIVPVLILIGVFAWRYRAGNKTATYAPYFDHSTALELGIWSIPLLIIICIGALTWSSTHLLDPFRRLDRIAVGRPIDRAAAPMRIQVVSMDWKWLFIYPDQNIATVNELALPVDREVRFDITSTNMMNSFYVPTLAGMIYAMPGMQSTLHAVINRTGEYEGFSANYSGAGFSHMKFKVKALEPAQFDQWVRQTQATGVAMTTADYLKLEKPTEKHPVTFYNAAPAGLFERVVNRCVAPGTTCISEHMRQAGHAGAGGGHAPKTAPESHPPAASAPAPSPQPPTPTAAQAAPNP